MHSLSGRYWDVLRPAAHAKQGLLDDVRWSWASFFAGRLAGAQETTIVGIVYLEEIGSKRTITAIGALSIGGADAPDLRFDASMVDIQKFAWVIVEALANKIVDARAEGSCANGNQGTATGRARHRRGGGDVGSGRRCVLPI